MRAWHMRGAAIALACAALACADEVGLAGPRPSDSPPRPTPRADAGSGSDAGQSAPVDGLFREDFDHLGYVDSSPEAIVDVNHGWVTLPAEPFPALSGSGARTLSEPYAYNGLIEAASIVVMQQVTVEATDSIELRATGTVHIVGRIRAGAGGVRIVAGRAIYVDGVIESDGPIRLQLTGIEGTIDIAGAIRTLDTEGRSSGSIVIEGRGGVHLEGTLETGSARYGDSGHISILAYGDVLADSDLARMSCGTSIGGNAGSISIATEGRVSIEGAHLSGGNGEVASGSRAVPAGGVEIRAADIALSQSANLGGGRSANSAGGSVALLSVRTLRAARSVQILGGAGSSGGSLTLFASTASIAAHLRAGPGDEEAGRLEAITAGQLYLEVDAQLVGGNGGCSAGGEVLLLVNGSVFAADRDVLVLGGSGGTNTGCFGEHEGGSVTVFAQFADPIEPLLQGGDGTPAGRVVVNRDPQFSWPLPSVSTRRHGWVLSQPIPRAPSQIGGAPELIEVRATTPATTVVRIELSDADVDVERAEWFPMGVRDTRSGEALRHASRLRYRVYLQGRAFDAPVVDGFDLDLDGR